jgi:hypothetical protein
MSTVAKTEKAEPTNGGNLNNRDEKTPRLFPATKVAQLKRTMDGAEKRMIRLQAELAETRAIIRRKYSDVLDGKGNVIGRDMLSSEHIYGLRLKRTQVEKDLALTKGDFLKARRAYRSAVSNNFQIERKSVQLIREENKIVRESKIILARTKHILREQGKNGGKQEYELLQALAYRDDIKAFRIAFDRVMLGYAPDHHKTLDGVSTVKTEVIHSIMEEMASEVRKNIQSQTSPGTDDENTDRKE